MAVFRYFSLWGHLKVSTFRVSSSFLVPPPMKILACLKPQAWRYPWAAFGADALWRLHEIWMLMPGPLGWICP